MFMTQHQNDDRGAVREQTKKQNGTRHRCEIKKIKHDRSLVRETEWSESDKKKQKQQGRINKDEKLGEGKQRKEAV